MLRFVYYILCHGFFFTRLHRSTLHVETTKKYHNGRSSFTITMVNHEIISIVIVSTMLEIFSSDFFIFRSECFRIWRNLKKVECTNFSPWLCISILLSCQDFTKVFPFRLCSADLSLLHTMITWLLFINMMWHTAL